MAEYYIAIISIIKHNLVLVFAFSLSLVFSLVEVLRLKKAIYKTNAINGERLAALSAQAEATSPSRTRFQTSKQIIKAQ